MHQKQCNSGDVVGVSCRAVVSSVLADLMFKHTTCCSSTLPDVQAHQQPVPAEALWCCPSLAPQAIREAREQEPATLVVVSSYHIGKERAFFGAARQLGCKVSEQMVKCLSVYTKWQGLQHPCAGCPLVNIAVVVECDAKVLAGLP